MFILYSASTVTTSTSTTPTTTTTTTTTTVVTEPPEPCLEDSDCQDNAGCFATDEIDPVTFQYVTTCHCFMGYLLDDTTASFPKTGFCEDLRTRECTRTDSDYCYQNDELWGICPYCRVSSHLIRFCIVTYLEV